MLGCEALRIIVPHPGIKSAPLALEGEVLTTGPTAREIPRPRSFRFHIPNAYHGICYRQVFYMCLHACILSRFSPVQLFVTPWTVARQIPLSVGFSRQEYWSGLLGPPPGIFLTQELNSHLLNSCIGRQFLYHQ